MGVRGAGRSGSWLFWRFAMHLLPFALRVRLVHSIGRDKNYGHFGQRQELNARSQNCLACRYQ
jgi:hypothetical protein